MSEQVITDTAQAEVIEPTLSSPFMELPLDAIETTTVKNFRTSLNGIDELALSIDSEGLLQPLIVAVTLQRDANGDVLVDSDGEPLIDAAHLLGGFRRKAAAERLIELYNEHNDRAAQGAEGFEGISADTYMFTNDGGEIITDTLEVPFEYIPTMVRVVDSMDEVTLAEAQRINLTENLARKDLPYADAVDGVCALLKSGMTQTDVGNATGLSQPSVSIYKNIGSAIDAVTDALREGKITVKRARAIAELKANGKPARRAQATALKEALETDTPGKRGPKVQTKRTTREITAFYHQLLDADAHATMDPTVREAYKTFIGWLNMACDTDTMVAGLGDIDFGMMPEKPAEKPKKAPKKAPAKAAASAKPARARRTPAKKTAAAPEAETVETTEAKPARVRRPRRTPASK